MQTTDTKSIPLIPGITAQPGVYTHATEQGIDWRYTYDIQAPGTKSEARSGRLEAEGIDLSRARPGDLVTTPWGVMLRAPDTRYERGWLLERTYGAPIDVGQGNLIGVPEDALSRGGKWTATVGLWCYAEQASAMESRSERRVGRLRHGRAEVVGRKEGDFVETPWGRMRWLGKVDLNARTDYEQGFLRRGTYDRSLDEMEGELVDPTAAEIESRLESLYFGAGFKLGEEGPAYRRVALVLAGHLDHEVELRGHLTLDPNVCSLDAFGDRQGCTKMAVRGVDVRVVRMRLGDPSGLGRRFFEVKGEGLPAGLALIAQKHLERCYLKLEGQLLPLYPDDGVP